MQRFKALLPLTRSSLRTLRSHPRALSAQPNYAEHDDGDYQEQILVEGRAKSRAAILNRPSSLNSLNASMVARLKRLYDSWEENSDIGFVLMKGSGRAFCSGADVLRLYHSLNGDDAEVAILDGITMGCGSGISLPGMFRVVTDKTVCDIFFFSHPEAQIGFHPDAGASYILSHLPGYLGEYLALTGDKLNGVEMIACHLATHYSLNARLALLEERLGKLITDEPSVVEASLAQYGDLVYPDKSSVLHSEKYLNNTGHFEEMRVCLVRQLNDSWCGLLNAHNWWIDEEDRGIVEFMCATGAQNLVGLDDGHREIVREGAQGRQGPQLKKRKRGAKLGWFILLGRGWIDTIDRCFSHETVEEIIEALEKEAAESYDEWSSTTLRRIREASPLSLKVILRSIREGRFETLDKCLVREYRVSLRGISKHVSSDFFEGVRARMVDKDFAPKWDPPNLKEISEDMVDYYFSPLESELVLPTALREPYIKLRTLRSLVLDRMPRGKRNKGIIMFDLVYE
ncbi:unnamed protein product [Sphenostylis stenocarpa]|uniref:3-hydroxyisobutyryl-CoA hydrolase n=1 Tax=Sphenostylis stenocarpa TaxID=92480 RepID=A0AA86SEZ1_9FABA|nr:unnamed protein product [Sphenostylis stenocarpa]